MNSIIFEGSGINGVAYIGVVRELEKMEYLGPRGTIRKFAGASSGAFISTALALGYSSYEIEDVIKNINLKELTDTCILKQAYNLISKYGLHTRDRMREKLLEVFEKKHHGNITFSEVLMRTGNFLTIVVTDIINKTSVYMNTFSHPRMPVIDALIASLSAPIIFTIDKKTHYIDGGITDNYPVWIYNDMEMLMKKEYSKMRDMPIPPSTLGVKVNEQNVKTVNNILEYILSIFGSMAIQLENVVMPENYISRTIQLRCKYDTAFDFDLNNEIIDDLIAYGREEALAYLNDLEVA